MKKNRKAKSRSKLIEMSQLSMTLPSAFWHVEKVVSSKLCGVSSTKLFTVRSVIVVRKLKNSKSLKSTLIRRRTSDILSWLHLATSSPVKILLGMSQTLSELKKLQLGKESVEFMTYCAKTSNQPKSQRVRPLCKWLRISSKSSLRMSKRP